MSGICFKVSILNNLKKSFMLFSLLSVLVVKPIIVEASIPNKLPVSNLLSPSKYKWVRVRLYEQKSSLWVKADSIESSKRLKSFQKISHSGSQSSHNQIYLEAINDKSPYKMKVQQGDKTNLYIQNEIFLFGKNLKIGTENVPPVIKIKTSRGALDVIAFVPLETYLAGVIQGEVPLTWSDETLKAQIIAARTYALNLMEEKRLNTYDLEASVKDQVFKYSTNPRILALTEATQGQVLIDQANKIIKAYYHSDCGGRTSSVKEVFGYSNDRTDVVDPFCRTIKRKEWRQQLSTDFIKSKIGDFTDIRIKPLHAERNFQVTIVRDDEDKEIMNAQVFREKMGFSLLKSTWFKLIKSGKNWIFTGRGYGHGVGMCQWGAKVMGDRGYSYKDILQFYYPRTHLLQLSK
ncbi:MAG: SpoIID/LytB domain-containing protein [Bdellovibrionales bacterium]|nr:SpoIID/LytB domain-containing protein [Bdellovibrionales bacterium]